MDHASEWIVSVLLPLSLNHRYHYVVKAASPPAIGTLVEVEAGRRTLIGAIWHTNDPYAKAHTTPSTILLKEAKPLIPSIARERSTTLPLVLSPAVCAFIHHVSSYYLCPLGKVLALVLAHVSQKGTGIYGLYARVQPKKESGTLPVGPYTREVWESQHSVSKETFTRNIRRGTFMQIASLVPSLTRHNVYPATLTPEQEHAAAFMQKTSHTAVLLEGVTGSGKTQVYAKLVHDMLARGKQVLVLLPEISLCSALAHRLHALIGIKPWIFHAGCAKTMQKSVWYGVLTGQIPFVVGTRSALLLPFRALGLIVMDEEHTLSYKQEEGMRYHGRFLTRMQGYVHHAKIIYVSATPTLETLFHAQKGAIGHVTLKARYGGAGMPVIHFLPVSRGCALGKEMQQAIHATLARKEQALIFLNRRGYAPFVTCATCGMRVMCSHCSAGLVFYAQIKRLLCHYCLRTRPLPFVCATCKEPRSLSLKGIGLEQLYEEVRTCFPNARLGLASSDTLTKEEAIQAFHEAIVAKEIDIIVGTQIMAKGYHFPNLTCVGIIDGDDGLFSPDFRAPERMYQLFTQVGGRAGREAKSGAVWIQTQNPSHPVFRALATGDTHTLHAHLLEGRKKAGLPPFGKLAALIIVGKTPQAAESYAYHIAATVPGHPEITVLGPIPAPLARLKGQMRWRFLIKATPNVKFTPWLAAWLCAMPSFKGTRYILDRDPENFL